MKRGVIIDLKDNFAIVLTADGHFVKTRDVKSHYQLGEEIVFNAAEASRSASPKRRGLLGLQQLRIGFVTAIAIILLFFSLYPVFNSDKVYAYMTIDINPSFELAINGKMEVVNLEPLNKDGEKLLSSFPDWNKQGFQSVVNSIIKQSRTMGYTESGKEIFITTVVDRKNDRKFEANLLNHVQMMKSSYQSDPLIIKTVQSDMETREKAKSEGVSTGTYIRNHNPPEKSSDPSGKTKRKPVPDEKPGTTHTPAPKTNKKESKPESEDKACKAPPCTGTESNPPEGKQKPDPDALKEMEKKGKQPPSVPPKRDESSQIPVPKQESSEKKAEPRGFAENGNDSEDDEENREEDQNEDSHSEDSDDEDEDKKKDKKLNKKKDQLKAKKQRLNGPEEYDKYEKLIALKLQERVKQSSKNPSDSNSVPEGEKKESEQNQELNQAPDQKSDQQSDPEPDQESDLERGQETDQERDQESDLDQTGKETIKQDELK